MSHSNTLSTNDVELDNYAYSRSKLHAQLSQSAIQQDSVNNATSILSSSSSSSITSTRPSSENDEYQDGGLKAYSVTLGSFLGLIVNLGLINSIGALQTYISRNQLSSLSQAQISWIFGVYLSLAYAGGLITGPIFDRHGPLWLLIISTGFIFMGLMGAANSFKIWHFILSFISLGIGNGLGMTPLVGVISHWFDKKRGVCTGLATCGGSVGGLVFPLMLRSLYVKCGYVWAVRILAFICLGCMICAILLVKERFRKESNNQSKSSSSSSGSGLNKQKLKHALLNTFRIEDYKFVYIILGSFFAELSLVLLVTYFASYAIAQGITEASSYLLLTVWNAVGILGRFTPGYASDIYGRFNVNILMLICYVLTILVLLLPFGQKSHGVIWAFAVLGGFCSGSILSLLPACLSQITPVNEIGKKYGILNSLLALANLFGVPIAATIIKQGSQAQYTHFILFVGILALCGTIFWYFSRIAIVGIKINVKV
ncbi:hypothetical protein KGF56_003171 [Candida oxycetoniae]|uniref:Major facilitator superfamily (MFS) profile domain-containing protein n=1 Tax=Candida oxycetoniae TaxID=497107 RepID=A0AAI9SWD8_9ASCO|nr:uncharacterized protein KGF56_003171 [Candida oxycetoniae]KAI3404012.2 hypothetical protein KGF56_003171 [Candida oxycetoniae]